MQAETDELRRARRAYEMGRLQTSAWRALCVTGLVAVVGGLVSGRQGLVLLPLAWAAWTFAHWRGQAVLRGALYGLAGGIVTSLLPMSILRPCCNPDTMASGAACCTMPGACVASGALVGILLSAVVPYDKAAWWKTAAAVALGMTSVAVVKCASLFAGEALGLIGGLVAGVVVAAGARIALARCATT